MLLTLLFMNQLHTDDRNHVASEREITTCTCKCQSLKGKGSLKIK